MKIVLRSLSHPKLDALVITDGFCLIGRDKPPFTALKGPANPELAVHHACILRYGNECYLLNFGIGAATQHNGRMLPPKRLVKLAHNDELWFTGNFRFRLECDEHATALPAVAPIQVALLPAANGDTGATIAIHGTLPLLIGRDMMLMVLAESETAASTAIKALSRCHALLFRKDDRLHVMDLGSANGTWLGDGKIPPYTELPIGGDAALAFGHSRLRYTVQVKGAGEEDRSPEPEFDDERTANSSGLYHVGKTVYIKAANSFLKILTDQPADIESADPVKPKTDIAMPVARTPLGKMRLFVRELREALGRGRPRHRAWLAGIAVGIALVATGLYFYNAPRREIKALIAKGEYQSGLDRANEYLRGHPHDVEVSDLALEGLVKKSFRPGRRRSRRNTFPLPPTISGKSNPRPSPKAGRCWDYCNGLAI